MSSPRPRYLTPEELEAYGRDPFAFLRAHGKRVQVEPGNPSRWCEECRSYHPDTTVCVSGQLKCLRSE